MEHPSGDAFVLWIDRAPGSELAGVVEHVADSSRRRFENVEELGRLLVEALDDARNKEGASNGSSRRD